MKITIRPCPELRMDQTPTTCPWKLLPLFKLSDSNDYQSWQVGYNGIALEIYTGSNNELVLTEKITPTTDPAIQARKLYIDQCRKGFRLGSEMTSLSIEGMKGYDYKPNSIKKFPVYLQPKLNGIRMLASLNYNTISFRSWLNNSFTNLDHIHQELYDFFYYLPAEAILDGELYNHVLPFTTITSAIKTSKRAHPLLSSIQFHIFDICYAIPTPFESRYELLVNAFRNFITDRGTVPTTFTIVQAHVVSTPDDISKFHDYYVATGYEGVMIKKISHGAASESSEYKESLYVSGKCNHILKYKNFIDEEVVIVNVGPQILVRDKMGRNYYVTTKFNLTVQHQGKDLTIRYRELLPTGIPKHPIAVAIRDYE